MVKKQEQAREAYMEQATALLALIEKLTEYADSLYDVRGPEEVTWADVEELKAVNNQLGYALTLTDSGEA